MEEQRMCVFCELRVADSPEHLTPDWLRKELPRHPKAKFRRGAIREGVERALEHEVTPFDAKERCVCTPCNTHWMSTIDNAVKPELLPLVLGRGIPLDAAAQHRLATWAFKTCLVYQQTTFEVVDPWVVIPREHYRYLYSHRRHPRPTDRVQIWLGAYQGDTYSLGNYYGLEMVNDGSLPTGTKAYQASLMVGRLLVQIFATYGYDEGLAPLDLIKWGDWGPILIPIWPILGTVTWPPPFAVNDEGLVNFVLTWSHGDLDPRTAAGGTL